MTILGPNWLKHKAHKVDFNNAHKLNFNYDLLLKHDIILIIIIIFIIFIIIINLKKKKNYRCINIFRNDIPYRYIYIF